VYLTLNKPSIEYEGTIDDSVIDVVALITWCSGWAKRFWRKSIGIEGVVGIGGRILPLIGVRHRR
jgi:hypothetical protein